MYIPSTVLGPYEKRTEPGELLWPSRFGPEDVTQAKLRLGSYAYAGQFQQHPSPAEGGIIKRQWWRFWQPVEAKLPPVPIKNSDGEVEMRQAIPLPFKLDEEIQSWDMTFKDTKGTDFVAGGCWGRKGADAFLLDQDRARRDFPSTVAAVEAFTKRHPKATAKLIEDKANGPAVIASLRHKVPGLIAVEPQGGKVARAHAVSPYIESGNVYLPHPAIAPWVWGFIDECAAFPNGSNDDQVDQMTQALSRLLGRATRADGDFPVIQR